MLEGLQEYGMVVQEEDSRRWRLGPKVAFWAGRYLEGPASLAPLRMFVCRLSRETQFVSYLTVLDLGQPVCVAVERPENRAQFLVQLGRRLPILSSAAARALLAYQPEDLVRPLVERSVAEDPHTRLETLTVNSYFEELAETRRRGYAKCMEELEVGISALSVPVFNARRLPVASLSVVATTAALAEAWDSTVEKLLVIADQASSAVGAEIRKETRR
jgi:DNA-binding IclR family transcriptional regulator